MRSTLVAPMSSTKVPSIAASLGQSRSSCPVTTVNWRATRTMSHRNARGRRHRDRTRDARHDLAVDCRLRHSASNSSAPRPKTNGSPPLSRTTLFPCCASEISRALIASCGSVWLSGALPASITSTSGAKPIEQRSRAEPIDDHNVGLGQQAAAAHGDEVGVARAAADKRDRPGASARRCARIGSSPVSSSSRTASRNATERSGSPALMATTVSSTRATAGVQAAESVAADARTHQMPRAFGIGRHDGIDLVAGAGLHQPRAVEVGRTVRTRVHDDAVVA